jgi:threonine aldolase
VICYDYSHVERDECGAPEFFSNGTKILVSAGQNGKLDPAEVETIATRRSDIHFPKSRVISLTQSTEAGTVYRPEEIAALHEVAKRRGMAMHMDGARFANAAAFLDLPPKAFTWEVGVDVLCFGGTKNGMAIGEAVVFFNREQAKDFDYRCKQAGQLCSKMRYLSAPWLGMLENDVWLGNGRNANAMARRLADGLTALPGVSLQFPVEANGVFVEMPKDLADAILAKGWKIYGFIGERGYRIMCSWQTTAEVVDAFLADARACAVV